MSQQQVQPDYLRGLVNMLIATLALQCLVRGSQIIFMVISGVPSSWDASGLLSVSIKAEITTAVIAP